MRNKKRTIAKKAHILFKISKKANRIAEYSHIVSNETGEDYMAMVAARLSTFCLKHLVNVIYKVEPDELDSRLKTAAMSELTERKVFGKRMTPWNIKDLYKLKKRKRTRRWPL